jgi:hypothetical protein
MGALLACGGAASAPPDPLPAPVRSVACADTCAGQVTIWRDAAGVAGRFVYAGDLMRCSHVMHVVYDAEGARLWGASDKPVATEQIEAIRAARAAAFQGFTEAETVPCR